jgi:hypothetical protein
MQRARLLQAKLTVKQEWQTLGLANKISGASLDLPLHSRSTNCHDFPFICSSALP